MPKQSKLVIGSNMDVDFDKEGFLRHLKDWSPEIAVKIAGKDGITLTQDHWEIINLTREYYGRYKLSPAARVIVGIIKENMGPDKASSIYLMKLFTGRPARMVNKISGLPKPNNCD